MEQAIRLHKVIFSLTEAVKHTVKRGRPGTRPAQPIKTIIQINTAFILALIAGVGSAYGDGSPPLSRGGSNYAWYNVVNCDREPYGILKNYHTGNVKRIVQRQLANMYRQGQRGLRVPLFHARVVGGGTNLKSDGGDLEPIHRENLANFLEDVRNAGFNNLLFGFFPVGDNDPNRWTNWSESHFIENWNVVVNLRPIIISSGLNYKIDLRNEGAPADNQPVGKQYAMRMWDNYAGTFGRADTVGFSVPTGTANDPENVTMKARVRNLIEIYDNLPHGRPFIWDFHIFDDFLSRFNSVDEMLDELGEQDREIIIGETYYNHRRTNFRLRYLAEPSRIVQAVYQWPLTARRSCNGVDVRYPRRYVYK